MDSRQAAAVLLVLLLTVGWAYAEGPGGQHSDQVFMVSKLLASTSPFSSTPHGTCAPGLGAPWSSTSLGLTPEGDGTSASKTYPWRSLPSHCVFSVLGICHLPSLLPLP